MQISDTSNLQGILQDIDFRCSTNANRYSTANKIRNINNEYLKIVEYVTRKSKKLTFADTFKTAPYNYSDYTVTTGQNTISDITRPFKYQRAEIKLAGTDDNWNRVDLITRDQIGTTVQGYQDTNGIPRWFTIDGDQITFYPTPDTSVATTDAFRIYEQQEPTLFDAADTTEIPVLPQFAHPLLSIGASIVYCQSYKKDRVPALQIEYNRLWEQLGEYLADTDDIRPRIVPYSKTYK